MRRCTANAVADGAAATIMPARASSSTTDLRLRICGALTDRVGVSGSAFWHAGPPTEDPAWISNDAIVAWPASAAQQPQHGRPAAVPQSAGSAHGAARSGSAERASARQNSHASSRRRAGKPVRRPPGLQLSETRFTMTVVGRAAAPRSGGFAMGSDTAARSGFPFSRTATEQVPGQAFRRSGVQAFRRSGVQAFRRSGRTRSVGSVGSVGPERPNA
jgi:hypothetical protein